MKHDRPLPSQDPDSVAVTPEAEAAPVEAPKAPETTAGKAGGGSRKKAILGLVALLVLGAGGYEGYKYWTVGRFMESTDDAYVQADITLISSKVLGYVTELPVSANTHVKKGDVLVRLDDGDYRIALETARSKVTSADETLARIDAQITAAKAAVSQAVAGQDAAEATLRSANSSYDRTKGLKDRAVATQAALDTATETLDTATASLASAKAAVVSAEAQVSVLKAQRAEAEGSKHQLELAVKQAELDLERTVLRAPADGVIANLNMEKGDLVSAGTRLAALVPDQGFYIEANFKETQMEGIAAGAEVTLSFDALPDREFEGKVASAAPATGSVFSLLPADNATGNFTKVVQRVPVRIEIPEEALATGQLRAGLSVEVNVDSRTVPDQRARLAAAE